MAPWPGMGFAASTASNSSSDRSSYLVALAVALLSVLVACAISQPWEGVHPKDGAYYAYLAELLARGIVPYRDVFHIQGPILVWLGGLSASLAGPTGLMLQGALVCGLMTFCAGLLSIGAQRNRSVIQILPVALVAWGVSTGWPFIGDFIVSGSRPKFLSIGLAALAIHLLCGRRRARSGCWSGAAIGAACWAWQPAAAIAIGSLAGWSLVRLREERSDALRDLSQTALQVVLGVVAFSAVAVSILIWQDSLDAFVAQAIHFSVNDAGPGASWRTLMMLLPMPVIAVGGAGLLGAFASLFGKTNPAAELPLRARQIRGALLGWFAAYCALIWIDFDYRGDTVPLLLPLGVFAGALMSRIGDYWSGRGRLAIASLLTVWLAGGDMLLPVHHSTHPYNPGQRIRPNAAADALEASRGRGVLIFADLLLAQQLGENPKHPYVYWEPSTIEYIEEHEEGGVDGFLDRLIAKRYGAVTLGPRAGSLLPLLAPKLEGIYRTHKPFRSKAHSFVLRQR